LEHEHDNLRAALIWTLEQETGEWAGRLVSALWPFWWERGYLNEGRLWLDLALTRSSSLASSIRAKVLVGAGFFAGEQGEYERAQALLRESLALSYGLQNRDGTAQALKYLGRVALYIGDYTQARELLQKSLHIARQLGNKQLTADILNHLGLLALYQADYEDVRLFCLESVTLFRELDDKHGIALCLHNLGWAALNQGDYRQGVALCEESLTLCRAMRRTPRIAGLLIDLGYAALYQGAHTRAATLCVEALLLYRQLGSQEGIAFCLEGIAGIAAMRGVAVRAVQLFGTADALRDTTHAPLPPLYRAYHDRSLAAARVTIAEATFATAWAAGQAMSLERAIEYALEGDILPAQKR
jgi:tetratricopeptide (TPR) repeat protein